MPTESVTFEPRMMHSGFSRCSAIAGLLVLLLTAGCASKPVPVEPAQDGIAESSAPHEVYLLRGLWNVFSRGLEDIEQRLLENGVDAGAYSGPSWPEIAQEIVDKRKSAKRSTPLVISGHSYGADNSIRLARALDQHGVTVDALILVDPTVPPKIPANVRYCVNIYRSKPATDWMPWLRGVPVSTAGKETQLVNRDVRNTSIDKELNHFNIEEHPAIQDMVLQEIMAIVDQDRQGAGQTSETGRRP